MPERLHDSSTPKPGHAPSPAPRASTLPRRLSESQDPVQQVQQQPQSPVMTLSQRPSYSRQTSRDSVGGSSSPGVPPRRPHTSVPAPEEDEMAPQSVSFIDSSADDNDEHDHANSKRLSQLNITSGSKTYRVVHNEKESSPSPTRHLKKLNN